MLPQFTCSNCGNHQLTLISYIRCEQAVEIGINNIHYEVTHTNYDDMLPHFTCYLCASCKSGITNEDGEEITSEDELKTYLHNQHKLNSAGMK